jgi:DNA polymerase-3 subunit epsilon/ATP-dependent DNA helicase DinG
MLGELIALDLETTGLDPTRDSILEIAAVRFRDGVVINEFSMLVDPLKPVPPFVTQLTGITDDDVRGKPRVEQAIPRLIAFVGNTPIIAHSITLDAGFLYHQGALKDNLRMDTHEIAGVLLPRAARYTLSAVCAQLDVPLEHAHRALDDARATAYVYWKLWQKALTLPPALLAEIIAAAQPFKWDGKPFFEAVSHQLSAVSAQPSAISPQPTPNTRYPIPNTQYPIPNTQQPIASSLFSPQSPLPNYEHREGQAQMAAAVETALANGGQIMIEAATGIGKSYAYLAPALAHAAQTGGRVVISTSTLTLQDQLIQKDIPTLEAALGIQAGAAVLKGRGNYLCPRRFAALRQRGARTLDELGLLAKLLVWHHENASGEKQDVNLRGEEHSIWARLSAEDENCTDDMCEGAGGRCPFYRARQAALASRLLIVNHALLVADAQNPQRVLPEFNAVIVDEAHHLEDAVTSGMSERIDPQALEKRLNEVIHSRYGLLPQLLTALKASAPERDYRRFEEFAALTRQAAKATSTHVAALDGALATLLAELREDRTDTYQFRVTPELRTKAPFEQAQAAWQTLEEFIDAVASALGQFAKGLRRIDGYEVSGRLDLARAAESDGRYFSKMSAQFKSFFSRSDSNTIYWLTSGWDDRGVIIHSAPAQVGTMLQGALWSQKRTVVLTGATLQTHQGFDFVRERLGAPAMETMAINTPFDFRRAVLHYVVNDLPDTSERNKHQNALERAIVELATALDGRLLVLFTSLAQLRQTASAVTPRLALGNITVYDQLEGAKGAVEGFKLAARAVLMGTRSYWEGIDLPADSLRGVMIVRLPFSVPSDPIFATRAEAYNSSFDDYSVPEAVLRFRQGFGRLIRRASDKGVFVVMDGRLTGKSYGKAFLEALPEVTRQTGELARLGEAAEAWITQQ